jgi:hypothetical protein
MATTYFSFKGQNITDIKCTDINVERIKLEILEFIRTHSDFNNYSGQFMFEFYADKVFFLYLGNDVANPPDLLTLARKLNDKIDSINNLTDR